jgi:disulfide bond formation protein DsbB
MLNPVLDRWRLFALIAAAGMLAVAHAFQTFGGMAPCELCLKQRDVYWATGALALAFMALVRTPWGVRLRQLTCWILALAFLTEAGVAIYHAGVEWKFWPGPQACTGGATTAVSVADLKALLNATTVHPPRCDQPAWVFLGLSMAGWNAIAALILAALSLAAALRERAKP